MAKVRQKKYYVVCIIIYILCSVIWGINAVIYYDRSDKVTFILSLLCCVMFGISGILYCIMYIKKKKEEKKLIE